MDQPLVLAIDVGSTSAKAQAFDAAGDPAGPPVRGRVACRPDGTADPQAFAASVEAVVDEALRRPAPIAAVALSCAWHGLAGLGPDGAPVHPSLPASRLLRYAEHEPDAFAATARWCSLGELLESRWFASPPGPSSSMASASGLFDQETGRWDDEVLDAVGIAPSTLAPVDDGARSGLAPAFRGRWPALAGVPWFPALGDGACTIVGTGCGSGGSGGDPGNARAALTVGTSAAVRLLAAPDRRAARPLGLFAYLLDPGRVVLGAARSPSPGSKRRRPGARRSSPWNGSDGSVRVRLGGL